MSPDQIAGYVGSIDRDTPQLLTEYCDQNRVIRFSAFRDFLAEHKVEITEDDMFELLEHNKMFVFKRGCDVDGVYWNVHPEYFR